jgi:hypothetical protein
MSQAPDVSDHESRPDRPSAVGHLFPCPSGLGLDRRDPERHGQGRDGPLRRGHPDRAHLCPGSIDETDGAGSRRDRRRSRVWFCIPRRSGSRAQLEEGCRAAGHAPDRALDPLVGALSRYLGAALSTRVGAQHALDMIISTGSGPSTMPWPMMTDRAQPNSLRRRCRPRRGHPDLQDPDLHLSGSPRHPGRQCAARPRPGGRGATGDLEESTCRRD